MEWQKSLGRVQRVRRTSYRSNPYTMSTTCEVWINLLNTKHALRKQQLSGSTTRSKSHFTAKSLNVQSLLYALQLQREPARLDFRCIKDSSCLGSFPVFDFTNPEAMDAKCLCNLMNNTYNKVAVKWSCESTEANQDPSLIHKRFTIEIICWQCIANRKRQVQKCLLSQIMN